MKHVINLSGGVCSFWAAHRVIKRPDVRPEDVTLLFADTLIESPDLYLLNDATAKYFDISITRVSREIKPWDLFRAKHLIGNDRAPVCSIELKRKPLWNWVYNNLCVELFLNNVTVYVGFDWSEVNRLESLRAEHPNCRIEAPMTEPPFWDKCKMVEELEAIGLPVPRAYREGFPHNNCNRRCVRAGISHFVHLLKIDPEAFDDWEKEERITIAEFIANGVSSAERAILKDRRGGRTKPLTLETLRRRVEQGESFPADEWGGCGCGTTN